MHTTGHTAIVQQVLMLTKQAAAAAAQFIFAGEVNWSDVESCCSVSIGLWEKCLQVAAQLTAPTRR